MYQHIHNSSELFSALSEPTRLKIVELLATKGQMSATQIYEKFSTTPPAISQHLKVLRDSDLVSMEKHAQVHLYTINPKRLSDVESWVKSVKHKWQVRFDRMDEVLKEVVKR